MKIKALIFSILFIAATAFGAWFITIGGGVPVPAFTNAYSAVFNGTSSYQSAPNHASVNFSASDSFSGGAWVKPTNRDFWNAVISKQTSGSQGYLFYVEIGGKLRFLLADAAVNLTYADSANLVPLNVWTHVGWSYNGNGSTTGMKLYINGVPETKSVEVNNLVGSIQGGGNVAIGGGDGGTSLPWPGKIDEPFIVSGVLSDANFLSIYNSGEAATLSAYNPLVWVRQENNSADSGSLGLTFTPTDITFSTDVPAP